MPLTEVALSTMLILANTKNLAHFEVVELLALRGVAPRSSSATDLPGAVSSFDVRRSMLDVRCFKGNIEQRTPNIERRMPIRTLPKSSPPEVKTL